MIEGHSRGNGGRGHDLIDVRLHLSYHLCRLSDMPGRRAENFQLGIGIVEARGRGKQEGRHPHRLQPRHELTRVERDHYQVGLVADYGFDVRRETGEVGDGCIRGIGGELVHGDHLLAGADGEEHLGARR